MDRSGYATSGCGRRQADNPARETWGRGTFACFYELERGVRPVCPRFLPPYPSSASIATATELLSGLSVMLVASRSSSKTDRRRAMLLLTGSILQRTKSTVLKQPTKVKIRAWPSLWARSLRFITIKGCPILAFFARVGGNDADVMLFVSFYK